MKNKNLILLILNIPPPYGGGEIRSKIIEKYLKNTANFKIFSYSRPKGNKSTQGRINAQNLFFGFYYIIKCCALILRYRPNIAYFSIPKRFSVMMRMMPMILLASLMNVKLCGELAGTGFNFLNESNWKKFICLFALRRLHSIRFLGDHVKKNHTQYGLNNPIVFANGIRLPDERRHEPVADHGPLHILSVGALNRSKGTGRIVEAVALCHEHDLDVFCTLVGEWSDPKLKREMRDFVTTHCLDRYIKFTGLIKGNQKWDYYRKAAILAHPTEWDGQPLSILEALGMGLAVISTQVGAIPDTVKHNVNGILLDENTPQKLYEAIRELYFDRTRLKRMMDYNQADFDRRFTVERYLRNFKNWLETV